MPPAGEAEDGERERRAERVLDGDSALKKMGLYYGKTNYKITKIFCIITTLVAMKICGLKLADVVLKYKSTFKYIGCGLGIFTFAISYGLEVILLAGMGKAPHLSMYITNFGLSGVTSEVSLSALALIFA